MLKIHENHKEKARIFLSVASRFDSEKYMQLEGESRDSEVQLGLSAYTIWKGNHFPFRICKLLKHSWTSLGIMGDWTHILSKRKYRAQRRQIQHFDVMWHVLGPIFNGIVENIKFRVYKVSKNPY